MKKAFCFVGHQLHRHIELDGDRVAYDLPFDIPMPWDGLPIKEGTEDFGFVSTNVRSFRKTRVVFKDGGESIDVFVEVGMEVLGPCLFYYAEGSSD